MNLHENKELFQDAVIATSQQLSIKEIYIEKDYWVTFALFHIFKNDIGKETVFKGGTALSKCFGMIQRFSEDIDLVVYFDFTKPNSKYSDFESNLLEEHEIEFDQINDFKIHIHKRYLKNWIKKYQNLTEETIWVIREKCISDLQN